MKTKLWMGFAALSLMSGVARADLQMLSFCVNKTNDTILTPEPATCESTSAPARKLVFINVQHNGKDLRPSTNHQLVTKAVIVVRDLGESPFSSTLLPAAYTKIDTAIGTSGDLFDQTWLAAPDFLSGALTNADAFLRWSDMGQGKYYSWGDRSVSPGSVDVSAFSVMDFLIRRMKSAAPKIKEFTIVGFGVGAEFVNRYSIGTTIETTLADAQVPASVRYLMISPNRYTYLSGKRFALEDGFEKVPVDCSSPSPPAACALYTCPAIYDDYPYGLSDMTDGHYMGVGAATLKRQVTGKRRLLLVGSADTAEQDSDVCPVKEQGRTRLERGFNYMAHLRSEYDVVIPGTASSTEYKVSTASGAGFCVVHGKGYDTAIVDSEVAKRFWRDSVMNCAYDDPKDVPDPPGDLPALARIKGRAR